MMVFHCSPCCKMSAICRTYFIHKQRRSGLVLCPDQIFHARRVTSLKNRVWTRSLVKLTVRVFWHVFAPIRLLSEVKLIVLNVITESQFANFGAPNLKLLLVTDNVINTCNYWLPRVTWPRFSYWNFPDPIFRRVCRTCEKFGLGMRLGGAW